MASSLPPPTPEEQSPYKDLSGQVTKEEYPFAFGAFSDVYRGELTDTSIPGKVVRVAVKIPRTVHMQGDVLEKFNRRLNRETRVWHEVSKSPVNILPFFGLCYNFGPPGTRALISPLYDNGVAVNYLQKNTTNRLSILVGVACGLEYLHASGVIHGDIHCRNILIDDEGAPRLCDFGQSKLIGIAGFTATKFAGATRYLAPELLPTQCEQCQYLAPELLPTECEQCEKPVKLTTETDVYGFSMVALEIMSGKLPFFNVSHETIVVARVQRGQRPKRSLYLPTTFTEPLWELLVECWDQDKKKRPTMKCVLKHLEPITEDTPG